MKKSLPIALCITGLHRGGAELALCEIAIRLRKRGFEPVVYSLQPRPKQEMTSCVPLLEEAGIEVCFLDLRGWLSLPRGAARLFRALRKQRPVAFLSFLFHANILGRFAAHWAGIRHVFSGIRVAEHHARWHVHLDRLSSGLVERYVCVSHSVAQFAHETGGIPRKKLIVIPNGIDATAYPAERRDCGDKYDFQNFESVPGSKKAIFIGRIHYQKGVDWLLETAETWLEELPDWELLLFGDGGDDYLSQCYKKRDALGALGERIHFPGWRADVPEILAAAHLLVLPSRWEGMPNVVLQAMAGGLPVLATRAEGVVELLGPELAEQQCVEFGDTKDFCEKFKRIATHPDFAAELGTKNRLRVLRDYDLERMVRRYARIFTEALQHSKSCETQLRETD